MTPVVTLSQDAEELNLKWRYDDVVSMSFLVVDVDWSGTYRAHVRDQPNRTGRLLAELSVTATYISDPTNAVLASLLLEDPGLSGVTQFQLDLADSSAVRGGAFWDLQQDGGPTRLAGTVIVVQDVTV